MTYCPVSGVVFQVKGSSAHRELDGKTLHFCCERCAEHFMKNRERIEALRGFVGASAAE